MSLTKCPHCQDQHACHSHDSHADTAAMENVLFYIGYRTGKLADRLPFTPRITEIQLPSRHILALIQGSKTLDEVLAEVEEELGGDHATNDRDRVSPSQPEPGSA